MQKWATGDGFRWRLEASKIRITKASNPSFGGEGVQQIAVSVLIAFEHRVELVSQSW